MEEPGPRVSLNLRVTPKLKTALKAWADSKGVSINAAAAILLAEALHPRNPR